MIDLLSLAGDLLERTSSSLRVQGIVQLSLAPVFLLAAIGAVLNVVNARLMWIVDGIDRLDAVGEADLAMREREELPALRRRRTYAQNAVNLCTGAALTICIIVATLFISAFIEPQIGTLVAGLWVLTMGLLFLGLLYFLLETRIATSTARERRRLSRKIIAKTADKAETDA